MGEPVTNEGSEQGDELRARAEECRQLQSSHKSLLLSTLSADGRPQISYSPFVRAADGCFYIFVSLLASHTENLLANGHCSVMFIREESASRNLFARERLIFDCDAQELPRQQGSAESILELMASELGDIVGLLKGLADFRLFRIKPVDGRYIVGFGKAYRVDPQTGGLTHISAEDVRRT